MSALLTDNAWLGARCAIIGSGASLVGCNWRRFADTWHGRTIAVSRAGVDLPRDIRIDVWLSMDRVFWECGRPKEGHRVYVSDGGPDIAPGLVEQTIPRMGASYHRELADGHELRGKRFCDGLACANNSGHAAMHLAYLLGCREVYLLGFDCSPGKWTRAEPGIDPNQGVYDRWMATALRLASYYAEDGRRVHWINSGAAAPERRLYVEQ